MKKIALYIICIILLFGLTGCSNKKGVNSEDFKNIMSGEQFYINEVENVSGNTIKKEIYASNEKFQVEYYTYKTTKYASRAFKLYKKQIENYKNKNSKESEKKDDNYNYYSLESEDGFFIVAKSNDTLVYSHVNIKYKNDLKKTIKKINY